MLARFLLALFLVFAPVVAHAQETQAPKQEPSKTREYLTDAAIALIIVALSIAAYKASGRPCACPDDTMRNGRRCGGNSAWSRAGGAKPLCFAREIDASMIKSYRASNAIPPLK